MVQKLCEFIGQIWLGRRKMFRKKYGLEEKRLGIRNTFGRRNILCKKEIRLKKRYFGMRPESAA